MPVLILFAGLLMGHIFYKTASSLDSDAEMVQFALAIPGELVNVPQRAGDPIQVFSSRRVA